MRHRISIALALAAALAACGRCDRRRPGTPPPVRTAGDPASGDDAVALVDGEPIRAATLARSLREVRPAGADPAAVDPAVRRQVLDGLVDRALLAREARQRGLTASPEEVDRELARLRAEYPGARFAELLAQQGASEDELRTSLRERLTIAKLLASVGRVLTVSDDEVARAYEARATEFQQPLQVHAYQIVVRTQEEAARLRAELRRRGPDAFEEVARRVSIGPEATRGGDLGWFGKGAGMPAVFDACFSLPSGALSEVIASPYGYHLFKVVARRPARHVPLAEVSGTLRERILREKGARAEQELLATLRERARIEVKDATAASAPSP